MRLHEVETVIPFIEYCENFETSTDYFELYKEEVELELIDLHMSLVDSIFTEAANEDKLEKAKETYSNKMSAYLAKLIKFVKELIAKAKSALKNIRNIASAAAAFTHVNKFVHANNEHVTPSEWAGRINNGIGGKENALKTLTIGYSHTDKIMISLNPKGLPSRAKSDLGNTTWGSAKEFATGINTIGETLQVKIDALNEFVGEMNTMEGITDAEKKKLTDAKNDVPKIITFAANIRADIMRMKAVSHNKTDTKKTEPAAASA